MCNRKSRRKGPLNGPPISDALYQEQQSAAPSPRTFGRPCLCCHYTFAAFDPDWAGCRASSPSAATGKLKGGGTLTAPAPSVSPRLTATIEPDGTQVAPKDELVTKVDLTEARTVGDDRTSVDVNLQLNPEFCPILAVILAPKSTYRTRMYIGSRIPALIPATAIIETGAGIKVVRKEVNHRMGWSCHIRHFDIPLLPGENGGCFNIMGVHIIHVLIGGLVTR